MSRLPSDPERTPALKAAFSPRVGHSHCSLPTVRFKAGLQENTNLLRRSMRGEAELSYKMKRMVSWLNLVFVFPKYLPDPRYFHEVT